MVAGKVTTTLSQVCSALSLTLSHLLHAYQWSVSLLDHSDSNSQTCGIIGISSFFSFPQVLQVYSLTPVADVVGCVITTPSSQS